MKPVIVLVGRPNVGKSTLFNRLMRTRDALVVDEPGITRDRQYGVGNTHNKSFIVVDTAGVAEIEGIHTVADSTINRNLTEIASAQTMQAIAEANVVLFMVDGRQGVHPFDREIAGLLRTVSAETRVVVNKAEGMDHNIVISDFHDFGLGEPVAISATHGDGVGDLIEEILEQFPDASEDNAENDEEAPCIAVIGRPNVGKSTLVNAIVGEQRVVVYDQPGTTRDSIRVPFERKDRSYLLIDTAGVRRRKKISETIEKFSIIKTLQAIEESNVVLLVLDASEGITDQDVTLAGHVLEAGRAIVLVINKWDLADKEQRELVQKEIDRKLFFLVFASQHFISAKKGKGINGLFRSIDEAFEAAFVQLGTSQLNRALANAVEKTPPPVAKGRRIRLKFAHQGGKNPPTIVIHGNQVRSVPKHYQRYLVNTFRKVFCLQGTPLRLSFSQGDNPYAGRARVSKSGTRRKSKNHRRK
ncbi:MAG: ribosome biogenesis GTPase Der [Gammaproteobacteria bacterium]|nr:MAG: ribosome biogenesis GTPase Der [Gammaproteobacteria bacterium]